MVCGQAVHVLVSRMQCMYLANWDILPRDKLADSMMMRQLTSSGCQFAPVNSGDWCMHKPSKPGPKKQIWVAYRPSALTRGFDWMSDVAYGLHRRAFRRDRLPCQCMHASLDGSIPATMLSTICDVWFFAERRHNKRFGPARGTARQTLMQAQIVLLSALEGSSMFQWLSMLECKEWHDWLQHSTATSAQLCHRC